MRIDHCFVLHFLRMLGENVILIHLQFSEDNYTTLTGMYIIINV